MLRWSIIISLALAISPYICIGVNGKVDHRLEIILLVEHVPDKANPGPPAKPVVFLEVVRLFPDHFLISNDAVRIAVIVFHTFAEILSPLTGDERAIRNVKGPAESFLAPRGVQGQYVDGHTQVSVRLQNEVKVVLKSARKDVPKFVILLVTNAPTAFINGNYRDGLKEAKEEADNLRKQGVTLVVGFIKERDDPADSRAAKNKDLAGNNNLYREFENVADAKSNIDRLVEIFRTLVTSTSSSSISTSAIATTTGKAETSTTTTTEPTSSTTSTTSSTSATKESVSSTEKAVTSKGSSTGGASPSISTEESGTSANQSTVDPAGGAGDNTASGSGGSGSSFPGWAIALIVCVAVLLILAIIVALVVTRRKKRKAEAKMAKKKALKEAAAKKKADEEKEAKQRASMKKMDEKKSEGKKGASTSMLPAGRSIGLINDPGGAEQRVGVSLREDKTQASIAASKKPGPGKKSMRPPSKSMSKGNRSAVSK